MESRVIRIDHFPVGLVLVFLRLAGLVAVASGLVGGFVWMVDLHDRADGDSLRWGFWHNPFMQFPPFDERFLDLSMWVLLACSAAACAGGLMLLVPHKWGVPLVVWQARVAIIVNSVIAFFIVAMKFVFADFQFYEWHLGGTTQALTLRLGSIAVDLMLWAFLSSKGVREFWRWHLHPPERAFPVILKEPRID